jgi:hypothetical protein
MHSGAANPLAGERLYADVRRYESFGVHRYGSPGALEALDWIADELRDAGLAVTLQPFAVARQYDLESATLDVEGRYVVVAPHWWLPPRQASFARRATIAATGPAADRFVRLDVAYDHGAYLNEGHRDALGRAFARQPAAVLLTIDHPSGEIFTYNVGQSTEPWPVPVILVAPNDRPLLERAEAAGHTVRIEVRGRYRHDVPSANVIGRLDRGTGRWIVVSTPVTSWFTSTCERGPGIAGFLAMARLAATRFTNTDLMFVATAGHEIGHGGMEHFIRESAPPPETTLAWAHFGASLAVHADTPRLLLRSSSMEALTDRHFANVPTLGLSGGKAAVGELRDVHAAGYPDFFGMAGTHRFFHTPRDSSDGTSPEVLAPAITAFADTLADLTGP